MKLNNLHTHTHTHNFPTSYKSFLKSRNIRLCVILYWKPNIQIPIFVMLAKVLPTCTQSHVSVIKIQISSYLSITEFRCSNKTSRNKTVVTGAVRPHCLQNFTGSTRANLPRIISVPVPDNIG